MGGADGIVVVTVVTVVVVLAMGASLLERRFHQVRRSLLPCWGGRSLHNVTERLFAA